MTAFIIVLSLIAVGYAAFISILINRKFKRSTINNSGVKYRIVKMYSKQGHDIYKVQSKAHNGSDWDDEDVPGGFAMFTATSVDEAEEYVRRIKKSRSTFEVVKEL